MKEENNQYHNIDQSMREAATRIPVTFNPGAWDKLSEQLNAHVPPTGASGGLLSSISLNSIILLLASSAILSVGIIYMNSSSNSIPETQQEITPETGNKIENETIITPNQNTPNSVLVYDSASTQNSKDLPQESLLDHSIKELDVAETPSLIDTNQVILEIDKTVKVDTVPEKKPFVFW